MYGSETPAKLMRGNGPRLGIVIPMTYFSGLTLYFFSIPDNLRRFLHGTRRLFRRLVHGTGFRHNIISYFFHDICRLLPRDPCAKRQNYCKKQNKNKKQQRTPSKILRHPASLEFPRIEPSTIFLQKM